MESLSATYTRNADTQERADLESWLTDKAAAVAAAGPKQATPVPAKTEQQGLFQSFWETARNTFLEGGKNIADALLPPVDTAPSAKEPSFSAIGNEMKYQGQRAGQAGLGAMEIFTALPAGLGAAAQAALKKFKPGMEDKPVPGLGGGTNSAAGLFRTGLMMPQLLFDPKMAQEDPQKLEQAINAPLTYGELLNVVTMTAASVYGPKALKKLSGKEPVADPVRVPQPMEDTAAAAAQPHDIAASMQEAAQRGRVPGAEVPTDQRTVIQESYSRGRYEEAIKSAQQGIEEEQAAIKAELAAGLRQRQAQVQGAQEGQAAAGAVGESQARTQQAKLGEAVAKAPEETAPGMSTSPEAMLEAVKQAGGLAKFLANESGAVSPGALARIGVGAAVGCATAEDAHDCVTRALIGAGVGAILAPRLARGIVEKIKGTQETSGETPSQRSGVAVQASEQPFQPNYQRLDMTPAVKNLMVNVHRSLKEDILARRGPAKTNDAAVQAALNNIAAEKFTPERVLTLGDQEILTREDITAARILSKRAFEHAIETRDRILAGETLPEGTYKQSKALAGAMGRNTRVAQTRIAQAQQASAIKLGQERVAYRPEDVAHLADSIEPGMTDQQMAMMDSTIRSPEQMGRVATFLSVMPRAGLQALYFAYLSGKAALRNAIGNVTMMGLDVMDTGIGRLMPTWDFIPSKGPKGRILPGEATTRAYALGQGLVDHVRMIRHLDQLDAEAIRLGFTDSIKKSESRAPAMKDVALSLGADEGSAAAHLGDWADKVTTFPGTVLDKTDLASKAINGRMELHSQAMYQAAREGKKGDAFTHRVGELVDDVTQLSQSARDRIVQVGQEQTFTGEFQGRLLRALAQGPENEWLNLVYRSMALPFFRVMARMTEQAMARTPGLNFLAKQFWQDFNAGGVRRQKAQARVVGGAGIGAAFMYLESQGGLTGNAPTDPKLAKLWQDAGYQQRSFWDPINQQWRSYDGLGPVTNLISTGADTSMAARKLPESDAAHLFFTYVLSTVNNLDSRTFTQTISNLMDVIKNPSNDSQVEKAMDFLRKQVAGWAKPGVARELETIVDPTIRHPVRSGAYDENSLGGSVGREFQMLLDDVRSAWPGFSDAKDAEGNFLVPPTRDRLTGVPSIVESWPFNPMNGRTPKALPFTKPDNAPPDASPDVRHELLRLNGAGVDPIPNWIGGANPGAGAGFSPGNLREGIRLTGQAQDRWAQLWLQEVKNPEGQTYAVAMKALFENPFYWAQSDGSRGTDGGKATMIQAVDHQFRQLATEALYTEAPALKTRVLARQAGRAIQKVPTAQQPAANNMMQQLLQSLPR